MISMFIREGLGIISLRDVRMFWFQSFGLLKQENMLPLKVSSPVWWITFDYEFNITETWNIKEASWYNNNSKQWEKFIRSRGCRPTFFSLSWNRVPNPYKLIWNKYWNFIFHSIFVTWLAGNLWCFLHMALSIGLLISAPICWLIN